MFCIGKLGAAGLVATAVLGQVILAEAGFADVAQALRDDGVVSQSPPFAAAPS